MTSSIFDEDALIELQQADTDPLASPLQLQTEGQIAIRQLHRYHDWSGLPLLCWNCDTETILTRTPDMPLAVLDPGVLQRAVAETGPWTDELVPGLVHYGLPLPMADGCRLVALGHVPSDPRSIPTAARTAAVQLGWDEDRLQEWFVHQPCASREIVARLVDLTWQQRQHHERFEAAEMEIAELADRIERMFEEISLLHALARNLHLSCAPVDLAELALERISALIHCGGVAAYLQDRSGETRLLTRGCLPFDEEGFVRFVEQFSGHNWQRPLVRNNVADTLLGRDFAGLDNFVLAEIAEGSHRTGWLLICNLQNGREFGTIEASLLNSVATILGVHARNIDLYQEHEELLVSFVRSMVSTLDAKDPYTRGHSQRVAAVARRIAVELGLPPEDVNNVWLSGLLHDIGKIGVDDRVLRKPGRLTPQEFEHVKKHPEIGYQILKGLTNLRATLPGVRHHHERFDGSGYPDGLAGEEIPFLARILAVADAFDAMCSDRPYRRGMAIEQVEAIFRQDRGAYWDPRVIRAYFQARKDIHALWQNLVANASDSALDDAVDVEGSTLCYAKPESPTEAT
ncbi:MAG: HD-GYP domain-containing protein [Planctomycetota bacterium]|nr:MAG: HD-GYP domain-containing protein [Planctomycetota bacterium]